LHSLSRWLCALLPWKITGKYIDQRSGKNGDREEFKRMMNNAYQREFDVVLFWSLDRFSREGVLETLQHLKRLSSYGVAFKSFTEQYLDGTGIFKDAIIGILAALAHQERVRLSERVVAGLERARKQGRVGGVRRFAATATRTPPRFANCAKMARAMARSLTSWDAAAPTSPAYARRWAAHQPPVPQ
jgi:DNA invertase Pin-like site-specific DNA recombinase